MNILLEIGHPAHVHFFARAFNRLTELKHRVLVVSRAKEMTNDLLERMGIPYECLSRPARGKAGLLIELLGRWLRVMRLIRSQKIDVAVSISGISTAVPARLCGIRNIVFTDTEDATLSNRIAFPFADRVYTPLFFLNSLGAKHRPYRGVHELAYLQRFEADRVAEDCKAMGLPERYVIVRLVANDALHDSDIQGIGNQALERLIERLLKFGRVLISASFPLPPSLQQYALRIPVERVHSVMANSALFVGDSPTMAVESSLLGVPAFLVSGRVGRLGNMVRLERDHQLLRCFMDWGGLERALPKDEAELTALRTAWKARAREFVDSCVDVDQLIVSSVLGEAN